MNITFPKSAVRYCELQCNSVYFDYSSCPEVMLIKDFLSSISAPENCLDIGSGLGRISVYLNKYFSWPNTKYWLMDGDTGTEQIAGMSYEAKQAFYNSMRATRDFCLVNELTNFDLINLSNPDPIPKGIFDLCYSCKAIGFHWPVQDYLAMLESAAKSGAHIFFELRSTDQGNYKEKIRWERACRFTDFQLKSIEANKKFRLIGVRKSKEILIAILQKE